MGHDAFIPIYSSANVFLLALFPTHLHLTCFCYFSFPPDFNSTDGGECIQVVFLQYPWST